MEDPRDSALSAILPSVGSADAATGLEATKEPFRRASLPQETTGMRVQLMAWRYLVRFAGVVALLGFSSLAHGQPWTPPLGIPAPSFGITQTAGAFTHYVDNTATGATD